MQSQEIPMRQPMRLQGMKGRLDFFCLNLKLTVMLSTLFAS